MSVVAQRTQRDPKEYLPFLKELLAMPEDRRRVAIDKHLRRFPRVVRNIVAIIVASGDAVDDAAQEEMAALEEECMDTIVEHKLFHVGLEAFRDTRWYRRVLVLYGEHLLATGEAAEAVLVFASAKPPHLYAHAVCVRVVRPYVHRCCVAQGGGHQRWRAQRRLASCHGLCDRRPRCREGGYGSGVGYQAPSFTSCRCCTHAGTCMGSCRGAGVRPMLTAMLRLPCSVGLLQDQ